jgi:hypothetical protein
LNTTSAEHRQLSHYVRQNLATKCTEWLLLRCRYIVLMRMYLLMSGRAAATVITARTTAIAPRKVLIFIVYSSSDHLHHKMPHNRERNE